MQGSAARLLRERREALNLTQWDVSRRADVREYDISRWERGVTKTLPLLGMWKICRVLGIDLEDLADALLADEAAAMNGEGADAGQAGGRSAASDEEAVAGDARRPDPRPTPGRQRPKRPDQA